MVNDGDLTIAQGYDYTPSFTLSGIYRWISVDASGLPESPPARIISTFVDGDGQRWACPRKRLRNLDTNDKTAYARCE
jgi:hypothetical protein